MNTARNVFCHGEPETALDGFFYMGVDDAIHVIAETDASGTLTKSYTYGPGIDNVLSFTTYGDTTNTYFTLTDHLGTVHALADETGTIVESYKYDAWGRILEVRDSEGQLSMVNGQWSSPLGNRILWQGREYSWATGLYYFRARWYDPITGRWLSNDPIGISGGLNQYVFCNDNPVNFVDPLGLEYMRRPWTPVIHHVDKNGQPVYDGADFLKWYTKRLAEMTVKPWTFPDFLSDVDVKVYPVAELPGDYFYLDGECLKKDEMGNYAAGFAMKILWGTTPAVVGSVWAEIAGLDDIWRESGKGEFLKNAKDAALGSWKWNLRGGYNAKWWQVIPILLD